jgi:acyl carrier protein
MKGNDMREISGAEALEMLTEVCNTPDIRLDTRFGNLEFDSLALVEWVSRLEEAFDAELDVRDLDIEQLNDHTVSQVLDVLRGLAVRA